MTESKLRFDHGSGLAHGLVLKSTLPLVKGPVGLRGFHPCGVDEPLAVSALLHSELTWMCFSLVEFPDSIAKPSEYELKYAKNAAAYPT